jgi:hypothetical protein
VCLCDLDPDPRGGERGPCTSRLGPEFSRLTSLLLLCPLCRSRGPREQARVRELSAELAPGNAHGCSVWHTRKLETLVYRHIHHQRAANTRRTTDAVCLTETSAQSRHGASDAIHVIVSQSTRITMAGAATHSNGKHSHCEILRQSPISLGRLSFWRISDYTSLVCAETTVSVVPDRR